MNQWGWFGCWRNRNIIVEWLAQEAAARGYHLEDRQLADLVKAAFHEFWRSKKDLTKYRNSLRERGMAIFIVRKVVNFQVSYKIEAESAVKAQDIAKAGGDSLAILDGPTTYEQFNVSPEAGVPELQTAVRLPVPGSAASRRADS